MARRRALASQLKAEYAVLMEVHAEASGHLRAVEHLLLGVEHTTNSHPRREGLAHAPHTEAEEKEKSSEQQAAGHAEVQTTSVPPELMPAYDRALTEVHKIVQQGGDESLALAFAKYSPSVMCGDDEPANMRHTWLQQGGKAERDVLTVPVPGDDPSPPLDRDGYPRDDHAHESVENTQIPRGPSPDLVDIEDCSQHTIDDHFHTSTVDEIAIDNECDTPQLHEYRGQTTEADSAAADDDNDQDKDVACLQSQDRAEEKEEEEEEEDGECDKRETFQSESRTVQQQNDEYATESTTTSGEDATSTEQEESGDASDGRHIVRVLAQYDDASTAGARMIPSLADWTKTPDDDVVRGLDGRRLVPRMRDVLDISVVVDETPIVPYGNTAPTSSVGLVVPGGEKTALKTAAIMEAHSMKLHEQDEQDKQTEYEGAAAVALQIDDSMFAILHTDDAELTVRQRLVKRALQERIEAVQEAEEFITRARAELLTRPPQTYVEFVIHELMQNDGTFSAAPEAGVPRTHVTKIQDFAFASAVLQAMHYKRARERTEQAHASSPRVEDRSSHAQSTSHTHARKRKTFVEAMAEKLQQSPSLT